MEHPPLFTTVADATTWLDAQPKAPRSPAFRALWAGLAITGGTASSNEVIALARLSGILDGIEVTDANLTSKIPPLVKCGLLRRVRPPLYAPKTTGCNGVRIGKRYHYVATKVVSATPSEASRAVPDEFIYIWNGKPIHFWRDGEGFRKPESLVEGEFSTPVSHSEVAAIFRNPAHKIFTPRRTGNHYDV